MSTKESPTLPPQRAQRARRRAGEANRSSDRAREGGGGRGIEAPIDGNIERRVAPMIFRGRYTTPHRILRKIVGVALATRGVQLAQPPMPPRPRVAPMIFRGRYTTPHRVFEKSSVLPWQQEAFSWHNPPCRPGPGGTDDFSWEIYYSTSRLRKIVGVALANKRRSVGTPPHAPRPGWHR